MPASARRRWPGTPEELAREQDRVASRSSDPWTPPDRPLRVGACAAVSGRAGREAVAWAAAVVAEGGREVAASTHVAAVGAPFEPGLLALREGPILEEVVRRLALRPDVLLVAAAGRDHPRGAGLALHLGSVLGVATVGVTDRPLVATGGAPARERGAMAPLWRDGEVVGYRVRTRAGTSPVVAHAAWRTSPELAAAIVLAATSIARWPDPLRRARGLARALRSGGVARGRS